MEMSLRRMDVIKKKKRKGFTLIELIVVIAIIGILAAIMIPKFSGFQNKARGTQAMVEAKSVATAIDGFNSEKGTWPATTAELAQICTTSGVAQTQWALVGTTGGFTVTFTLPDNNTAKAGRATGADPVVTQ